jgi:hypothetical protein
LSLWFIISIAFPFLFPFLSLIDIIRMNKELAVNFCPPIHGHTLAPW